MSRGAHFWRTFNGKRFSAVDVSFSRYFPDLARYKRWGWQHRIVVHKRTQHLLGKTGDTILYVYKEGVE